MKAAETATQPVVQAIGLKKTYYTDEMAVPVLHGIDLTVMPGDFVAIMGSSGSGKSTFMNIVGCLDQPTGGKYVLDGVDVSTLSDDRLAEVRNNKIGFVFQSFNLLPRTSALENVELPMVYDDHADMRAARKRAGELLRMVGLGGREDHTPNRLSGGQMQRVAIARALIKDPALLLADEPTGNLDSKTSVEIMSVFQRLNDAGKTIVLVTHEDDIARHARRVVFLKDGRVLSDKRVEDRLIAQEPTAAAGRYGSPAHPVGAISSGGS
jgi:putative ABC transport system ATP-binding protein